MFGIPGEIFWPTAAFASIILVVLAGVVLLRYLPHPKSRVAQPDVEALEDLQSRVAQLEQLQEQVNAFEERLDFAERVITKHREGERLGVPRDV
jgi:Tfp pilus assembly protein PilO